MSTLWNKLKNAKWLFLTFSLKASHLPLLSYAVNNFLLILSVAVVERELLFLSSKKWSGDFKRLWQPWIFEILVFDSYRTQFKTLDYFVVSWVFGYFWFRYFYIDTKYEIDCNCFSEFKKCQAQINITSVKYRFGGCNSVGQ